MRITRSGLRRIIAEESARILAEAHERVPGGHQMRIAAGFEDEPAEVDFEDEDEDDYTYGDDPDEFLDLPAGEIQRRLRDLDEGEEHSGGVYDMVSSMNPAFVPALKRALSIVVAKHGKMPTFSGKKAAVKRAEWLADVAVDVNYEVENLLADDPDAAAEWDEMGYTDAVDEYSSLLDAEIERLAAQEEMTRDEREAAEERERRDYDDTERALNHPSNFIKLEEGDDALDEYGDPNDSDPDGGYMGFMASDDEMNYLRGGGSYSDGPYADNDVPDNRYTRGRAKGFGKEPRVRGDDIDSGYDDDVMGDDNLSEGEGDSDGPDQYDPDDAEFHADNERQYQSALRFYSDEGGSSLKASHSDFDDVRGSAGPVKRFITRGPQGKPARVRGLDIDSGEDDLNESIDMLSAGIGAIVGIAALYAAGPLSRVAYNILDELSYQQQQAARAAASKEAGSKLAAAIENLSHDKDLIALFKELEDLQKSEEKGASAKISKKSKEITSYIKGKRQDMSFGSGDEQDVRRGVSKRLKKGEDDKGDKLDEARWAKLAGILKG